MDIDWLLRDKKNIVGLAKDFADQPDEFYSSDFVQFTLEEFWEENQSRIIWRQFIPYLTYLLTTIAFFSIALKDTDGDT